MFEVLFEQWLYLNLQALGQIQFVKTTGFVFGAVPANANNP